MKVLNRIGRGLATGAFSLAMLGGVGMPIYASTVSSACSAKSAKTTERQELRSMTDKMLVRAKADDAVLQNLIAKLKKAPEGRKVDVEAALLSELVAQNHQRLNDWEGIHNQAAQFRASQHVAHGNLAQNPTIPQK
ncbi:MAG TPA: hypothetical protein VH619_13665 [Verrucomicrobiae bacterium]|nr:hypothetical protein [Verrucomicrobiae bacterium]